MVLPQQLQELFQRAVKVVPELLVHRVLAAFEPVRDSFLVGDGSVSAITRAIRKAAPDGVSTFRTVKGRTDFLYAALKYLSSVTDHEEMLIAFGTRQGQRRNAPARLEGSRRSPMARSTTSGLGVARWGSASRPSATSARIFSPSACMANHRCCAFHSRSWRSAFIWLRLAIAPSSTPKGPATPSPQ